VTLALKTQLPNALADADVDFAAQIEQHATAIDDLQVRTIETVLKIGEHLDQVHKLLAGVGRDGAFAPWVRERCRFSTRTAYSYLGAYRTFGNKCEIVSHFSQRALYLLSSDGCPEAATEEAITRAEQGGQISFDVARELKVKHSGRDLHDDPLDDEAKPKKNEPTKPEGTLQGVGVIHAHEAINCLMRMPKRDALKKRGFQIVTDWIKDNSADTPARPHLKTYQGRGVVEWYTPIEWVDRARDVMGRIDLDPASCAQANEVVQAKLFYTLDDDALAHDWQGNVFLNPPYAAGVIDQFVDKLIRHYVAGDVRQAVLLTNNNTDAQWWHKAARTSKAICFTEGRIAFYSPAGEAASPTNGSTIFYFGPEVDRFAGIFGNKGLVVRPGGVGAAEVAA